MDEVKEVKTVKPAFQKEVEPKLYEAALYDPADGTIVQKLVAYDEQTLVGFGTYHQHFKVLMINEPLKGNHFVKDGKLVERE
jgi:hypothetical protein